MIEEKLYNLFTRVKKNVNYYSDILSGVNDFSDCKQVLENMPIISKDEIRTNIVDHINKNIETDILKRIIDYNKDFKNEYIYESKLGKLQVEYTSGTTGTPFLSIKTAGERISLGRALWYQRNKFADLKPTGMCCFMHSNSEEGMDYFNNLSIEGQLRYLEKKKFESWHIYPGKLEEYYEFLSQKNRPFCGVKYIECNGAYISEEEQEEYEKTFSCKIFNNYGSREVWNIAYSGANTLFHINDRTVYFEIVDEQNSIITNCNKSGNIVVTSLSLFTMPFIRYKIGDIGYYVEDELGNKRMKIVSERNMIIGKNLYGNRIFKETILFLNQIYRITCYSGIYIYQKDEKKFEVNINGFEGERQNLERAFVKCFYMVSKLEKIYEFEFVYNQKKGKSLFNVKRHKG